jgi:aminopeptidase N
LYGTKDKTEAGQELILAALSDTFWHIRVLAIETASKLSKENLAKAMEKMKEMALNDANSSVRSSAINFIANNSDSNENLFVQSIEKDKSYKVLAMSMRALSELNPTLATEKVKAWENETSSKQLVIVAQIYAQDGSKECFQFFNKVLKGKSLTGYDELIVLNSLTYFLTKQKANDLTNAYPIYAYLAKKGNATTKQFLGQNCTYLNAFIDDKIEKLNAEIVEFEKNNDALYADQTRNEIKIYSTLKEKFSQLTEK